jgi:hypothetical protein
MLRGVLIAVIATLIAAVPASGEEPTPAQAARDTMLRDDYSCTDSEAVDVDVTALWANRARYVDLCVRVTGYPDGHWLLRSMGDIEGLSVEQLAAKQPSFVGVEMRADSGQGFPIWKTRTQFVGRFRSCGNRYLAYKAIQDEEIAKRRRAGDTREYEPVWLTGTCHYLEYVLFTSQWRSPP